MKQFECVLLDVWREACLHIEITGFVASIMAMLEAEFPLGGILVRKVDSEGNQIETVAWGRITAKNGKAEGRTECSEDDIDELVAWCSGRQVLHGGKKSTRRVLSCLIPGHGEAEVLAVPLKTREGGLGALVLETRKGKKFTERHRQIAAALMDPFSTALENDYRLRKIEALQEAAEADRESLLNRLGRKGIGDTVIGFQTGLRGVMERVELVARSDAPVLIFGETGSGKEVIARAIHTRSPRAENPFIRVNCGAIPHELIDSELFGHEKGAFTGAVKMRKGWFERADGGTLLLDEIGELPAAAQVRLLRILQDGWLERVGGHEQIHVDVRILAATHADLAGMVSEGDFREDLWYRLAVFPLILPPLRERTEDIPSMARHFARRAALKFGLPPVELKDSDFSLLMSYSWPGNVRELASVIDRAAILGDGKTLEVQKALGPSGGPVRGVGRGRPDSGGKGDVSKEIEPLDDVVRRHIRAALQKTHGRIEGRAGCAVLLKINPHTLRARMRKLGIDWRRFRD